MTKAAAETEAVPEKTNPEKQMVVRYIYAPNRRGLTAANLAGLGLPDREDVWWDASNNWTIPLKDLDFPEDLARTVFNNANGFMVVEE